MRRLFHIFQSQIKYRIILPYLVLMILVTLVGSGIAIILVADNWQERFNNQLGQVARNFTGAMARQEVNNINFLARVAATLETDDTLSVREALAQGNRDALRETILPIFSSGIFWEDLVLDRFIVFDPEGQALLDLERNPDDPNLATEWEGTNLDQLDIVQRVRAGEIDQIGDKYSALIRFRTQENPEGAFYFFTAAPVYQDEELIGGLLIASELDRLLANLQSQSQSEITTIYDISGLALGSTVLNADLQDMNMGVDLLLRVAQLNELAQQAYTSPDVTAETVFPVSESKDFDPCLDIGEQPAGLSNPLQSDRLPSCSVKTRSDLNDREYEFVYAPLLIRGVQTGYFSISLSRDFVISAWSSSRWAIIAVTVLLAIGAVWVGYVVAQQITRPLSDLVATAAAVTQGQLDRRSVVRDKNELGKLASAFNNMTEHLLRLYQASRDLNRSIEFETVLNVTADAVASFVDQSEIVVLLESDEGWRYHVRSDASEQLRALQNKKPSKVLHDVINQQHAIHTYRIADEPLLQQSHLALDAHFQTALIAPLQMKQQTVGALIIGHPDDQAFTEADEQVLAVVANMSVTVLHNAVLYTRVQKDAQERRAMLTSIGDGVVVCDAHDTIVLLNPIAENLLDLRDWQTNEYKFSDLPIEEIEERREIFGIPTDRQQYRLGNRIVSLSEEPVIADDQRNIGKVIVLHDITNAVAIDQAKTDFIATISHELRTPLTVIRGFTELVLRGTGDEMPTPDQAELLQQVYARAVDMTTLVNNAILIADIESGKLTTERQPQDVMVILEMALAPMRSAFAAKGLELNVPDMSNEVPPVLVDREQLRLVLSQLLDNARRYTHKGQVTITVAHNHSSVQIDIADTGQGMSPDIMKRLFTRFQRIDGNTSAERGGGLGLAISKQLIERQGGSISVISTPGEGSTFTIIIPQANEKTIAVAQSSEAATTP